MSQVLCPKIHYIENILFQCVHESTALSYENAKANSDSAQYEMTKAVKPSAPAEYTDLKVYIEVINSDNSST